jgi:galactan 5-O-arabinofuranosyltransferase
MADIEPQTEDAALDAGRPPITLAEGTLAFLTAAAFTASCLAIRVNPTNRLGQISGLASLELRFFLVSVVLVGVLVAAARSGATERFPRATRLVCAAAAGLATAIVAGGILVALRGTHWGLTTKTGDMTKLAEWARALNKGEPIPPLYPPLSLAVLAKFSTIFGIPPEHGIKWLQIAGTASFGPIAYLCWRLLLRPQWALAIGIVATIPLIDPYKPYPNLVLVAFLPVAILFLKNLRDLASWNRAQIARRAIVFGGAFGLMCLMYSGWFKWAAPGLFVAALYVAPWKTARRRALTFLGLSLIVFLLISANYLLGVFFDPAAKFADNFVYFDVRVEPMYIAMWRNDLPGVLMTWPPIGEVGGVGLFTISLLVGLALAIALGRRSTIVIALVAVMTGAWFWRFWYAHSLFDTKLVQLYPRTTPLILCCLIVLSGMAVYWLVARLSSEHPLRGPWAVIGAMCGLLLLFASSGSSTADRYMPLKTTPPGVGWLAWTAHQQEHANEPKSYIPRIMPWVRRNAPVTVPSN